MYQPGEHIYLAGPFFNDTQRDLIGWFEKLEIVDGVPPIFSPRREGIVLKPDSPPKEWEQTFRMNVTAIKVAKFVLAIIDDFDPGTIWEMGYAYGVGIPTLAYSDVPGRGLNVMLAGSCKLGFINGRDDARKFLVDGAQKFPRNTWSGEIE